jgi:hypothetical protein
MRLYRFGFDERDLLDDTIEWHRDDVAAMAAAAQLSADMFRTRDRRELISLVLCFRVTRTKPPYNC